MPKNLYPFRGVRPGDPVIIDDVDRHYVTTLVGYQGNIARLANLGDFNRDSGRKLPGGICHVRARAGRPQLGRVETGDNIRLIGNAKYKPCWRVTFVGNSTVEVEDVYQNPDTVKPRLQLDRKSGAVLTPKTHFLYGVKVGNKVVKEYYLESLKQELEFWLAGGPTLREVQDVAMAVRKARKEKLARAEMGRSRKRKAA